MTWRRIGSVATSPASPACLHAGKGPFRARGRPACTCITRTIRTAVTLALSRGWLGDRTVQVRQRTDDMDLHTVYEPAQDGRHEPADCPVDQHDGRARTEVDARGGQRAEQAD